MPMATATAAAGAACSPATVPATEDRRPRFVDLATRQSYLALLQSQCGLSAADARRLEMQVYSASTAACNELRDAEDPLAELAEPADVAARVLALYSTAMRRAVLLQHDFGDKLRADVRLRCDNADPVRVRGDAPRAPAHPSAKRSAAKGSRPSALGRKCARGHGMSTASATQSCVFATEDEEAREGDGDNKDWIDVVSTLTDASAQALVARYGAWAGWKDFVRAKDAAAIASLTQPINVAGDEPASATETPAGLLRAADADAMCGVCGSTNIDVRRVQARSADEGETTFVKCHDCKRVSKVDTS